MPVLSNDQPEAVDAPLGRAPPEPAPQGQTPEEQEESERYHTLDPTRPEFLDRAAAALRLSTPEIQAARRGVEGMFGPQTPVAEQPGYNFLDYIPPGFLEQYGHRYVHTGNPAQAAEVTEQIREELRDQAVIARSGWTGTAAMLSAGAVDPVNVAMMALVPEAAPTRLGNAVRWGLTNALTTSAQEALRREDIAAPLKAGEVFNVSANAVLGGVLGAFAPRVPKATFSRLADELHADLHEPAPAPPAEVQPGAGIKLPETLPPDMLVPKQSVLTGVANREALPYTREGGLHTVRSENGETTAIETTAGDIQVVRSDTAEAARGKGEDVARMETLAQEAHAQGKSLISDVSVSPDQERVYAALKRRGYDVEQNPNATRNPDTGNLVSDDPRNPVFTVRPKPGEIPPVREAEGLEEQPLPDEHAMPGERLYVPEEFRGEAPPIPVNPEAESTMGAAAVREPRLADLTTARGAGAYTATVGRISVGGRLIRASSVKARQLLTELANIPGMLEQNYRGVANPNPVERVLWKAVDGVNATNRRMRRDFYNAYVQRVRQEGGQAIPRRQFMEEIAKAMRRGDVHEIPEIAKAAQETRAKGFEPTWKRAIEGGMTPEEVKGEPEIFARSYLMRLYDKPKIRAQFSDWIERLRQGLVQKHGVDPVEAANIAHDATRNIMGGERGTMDWQAMDGIVAKSGRLKGRTLPLPDEWLEPFLSNDIDHIEHTYLRTLAPEVELTERFGDRALKGALGDVADDYTKLMEQARAAGDNARVNELHAESISVGKQLSAIRDRLYGTYGAPKDPSYWAVRAGRFVRSGNASRLLGAATLKHFPDIANVVARYGMARTIAAMTKLGTSVEGMKLAVRTAQRVGAAVDMVMNQSASILGDYGSHSQFLEQRMMGGLTRALTIATGETPFITAIQGVTSVMAHDEILRMAERVAAGRELNKNVTARLASSGLDKAMLERIATAARGSTQTFRGLRIANEETWGDKGAAQALQSAIGREAHGVTLRPGVGDTPLMMSTEWGKLLLQFKTFAFAASRVVGVPLLQGAAHGDLRSVEAIVALAGMGALSYAASQKAAGQKIETNPAKLALEVADKSNILGWTGDMIFPSLYLAGFKDLSRWNDKDPYGAIGGPTLATIPELWSHRYPARIANLVSGGRVAPGQESLPFRRSDLHFARRMLWGQNMWYARGAMDKAEDAIGDLFNLPGESNAERAQQRLAENVTIQ